MGAAERKVGDEVEVVAGAAVIGLARWHPQARGQEREIEVVEQRAVVEEMGAFGTQAVAGEFASGLDFGTLTVRERAG